MHELESIKNFVESYQNFFQGLAQLGSKVVIASRSAEKIAAAAEDLKSHCSDGAEILPLQCNIRDRENVAEMMKKTLEKFGKIDGLVNNGGGQFWSPAEHINAKGKLIFF